MPVGEPVEETLLFGGGERAGRGGGRRTGEYPAPDRTRRVPPGMHGVGEGEAGGGNAGGDLEEGADAGCGDDAPGARPGRAFRAPPVTSQAGKPGDGPAEVRHP